MFLSSGDQVRSWGTVDPAERPVSDNLAFVWQAITQSAEGERLTITEPSDQRCHALQTVDLHRSAVPRAMKQAEPSLSGCPWASSVIRLVSAPSSLEKRTISAALMLRFVPGD